MVEARSVIDDYRSQTVRLDAVVRETTNNLNQGSFLARAVVVLGGALAMFMAIGLILTGRAVAALEER